MYWIDLGTEVAVLNSQVVPNSQVVVKTRFTVYVRATVHKSITCNVYLLYGLPSPK